MMNPAAAARRPPPAHPAVGAIRPPWTAGAPGGAPPPPLGPRQVHLWAVDLAPLQSRAHHALLSAPERARAGRHRNPDQRAMYLGGRVGLRLLLAAYTDLANDDLRFASGGRGKPSLTNELPGGELGFNYTLSGGRALYAFAWNREVGIDMETWPRRIDAARLARRKLAPVEQRAWRMVPAPWRDAAMLACWTRKEAYGKALGVGIRYTINRAPVCAGIASPTWRCGVTGLFEPPGAPRARPDRRILHGLQLEPPFPGIAALVHDGEALADPAGGVSLRGWRWCDGASGFIGAGAQP